MSRLCFNFTERTEVNLAVSSICLWVGPSSVNRTTSAVVLPRRGKAVVAPVAAVAVSRGASSSQGADRLAEVVAHPRLAAFHNGSSPKIGRGSRTGDLGHGVSSGCVVEAANGFVKGKT